VQETIEIIHRIALTPVNWSQPRNIKQKFAALYQSDPSDATKPCPEAYARLALEFHEQKLDKHVIAWAYYTLEQQSSLTDQFKTLVCSLLGENTTNLTEDELKNKLHSLIFA
jgi:hypothetical protein